MNMVNQNDALNHLEPRTLQKAELAFNLQTVAPIAILRVTFERASWCW